jgi:hypothetical protein
MKSTSNSAIERHYFEQFRAHFALPDGEVEYSDKPDVLINGRRRIGIEIANLYLVDGKDAASEQVQRIRRESMLKQAQTKYLAAGGKSMELTVSFDRKHPIETVSNVAQALAALAARIASMPSGSVSRQVFSSIPELAFVYHNPQEYADSKWRVAQPFSVPSLAVDRVREIVAAKHGKLTDYAPCDAYWLLMVVDFADSAQDQDISWPALVDDIVSEFERIVIYKPQFAECREVPMRKTTHNAMQPTCEDPRG